MWRESIAAALRGGLSEVPWLFFEPTSSIEECDHREIWVKVEQLRPNSFRANKW